MKNIYEFNKPIPFSLIIKLNITRIVIIWEELAKYFYRLLYLLELFYNFSYEPFSFLVLNNRKKGKNINGKIVSIKNTLINDII